MNYVPNEPFFEALCPLLRRLLCTIFSFNSHDWTTFQSIIDTSCCVGYTTVAESHASNVVLVSPKTKMDEMIDPTRPD